MLQCVSVTGSGIGIKDSVYRLLELKASQGFTNGPTVSNTQGVVFSMEGIDDCFKEALEDIFKTRRHLFPKTIKNRDDLKSSYQIFRSLRRSSDTQALEMKVTGLDIDIVKRWVEVEASKGRNISRPMKQEYADVTLLIKPFLLYTSAH